MTRALPLALLLSACATATPVADVVPTVAATAETDPVDTAADAADDPAIWRNPRDPAKSLVIGTDKQAGIHVYDLKGKRRSFTPAARLNNVDLRDLGAWVVVAASDRADKEHGHVALFTLDTARATLTPLGRYPSGAGEAYGMCLWRRARDGALFGFVVMKDGRVDQVAIDLAAATPRVTTVRSMKLATQAEGCVADDRTGLLYVAEEDVGLWRFAADPAAPVAGTRSRRSTAGPWSRMPKGSRSRRGAAAADFWSFPARATANTRSTGSRTSPSRGIFASAMVPSTAPARPTASSWRSATSAPTIAAGCSSHRTATMRRTHKISNMLAGTRCYVR